MKRERRSAKQVITDYVNELLARNDDNQVTAKLLACETIALRMGWNDLYNRLRWRREKPVNQPWWTK